MISLIPSSSLTQPQAIKKFIATYAQSDNWHQLDPGTGNLGYGWLHYAFIRQLKPQRILCIGSRYGFIPAVCALACKDNGRGLVDFVDAGYNQNRDDPHHWGGVGLWRKIDKNAYFKPFGLAPFLLLHVQTSAHFAKAHPHTAYEYIYLDGDHSYKGVSTDFKAFWPRLKPGGILALHDIFTQDSTLPYGVSRFWQELKTSKEYQCLEFPGEYGMGIIQKPA